MKNLNTILFATSLILALSNVANGQNQQFTTAGQSQFLVPTSVVSIKVQCVGAGGGGGRVTPSNPFDTDAAGGGGGGAYASSIVSVIEGTTYEVTVGSHGYNTGSSADGGNSYFATGNEVLAEGGKTRSGNDQETGASGGKAVNSNGNIVFDGGNGGNGDEGDANGGGGGGAAGSGGPGHNGGEVTAGMNQIQFGGQGGQGGPDGATGADGADYGGGGGGSSANGSNDRNGGNGADGIVVISWSEIHGFSPSSVCATGNSIVEIQGLNFTGVDSVLINGLSVPFNFIDDTHISLPISSSSPSGIIYVYTPNGACKSSVALEVIHQSVNPSLNGTTISANYIGSGSESYEWLDCINGNSVINGETNETFTPTVNGLYAVRVTENGCSITSSCLTVSTVDITEIEADFGKVYPNPFQNMLNIQIQNEKYNQVLIHSIDGKEVYRGKLQLGLNQIDISNDKVGAYLIYLRSDDETVVNRIVKM